LIGLTACAPVTQPTQQEAVAQSTQQEAAAVRLQEVVQTLLANQAAGRTKDVAGTAYVMAPIAVPLANAEMRLIPNTRQIEASLARFQRRWQDGKRQPLPFEEYQAAFAILTAHREAVGLTGGESLVRFVQTDDKGQFRFDTVPEGAWLLIADMPSSVSILLWVIPIDVLVNQPNGPPLLLTDSNLLFEAIREQESTRP
jgi:hypothetical protein